MSSLSGTVSTQVSPQVSRKGLADAELDRAAGEPAQREEDPDPQPRRGNHVRVSGLSPSISIMQPPPPTPFRPRNVIVVSFSNLLAFTIPDHWDQ